MTQHYLSVDIGGTSLRLALIEESGEILLQRNLASDLVRKGEELLNVLAEETRDLIKESQERSGSIGGLALGVPGLVDARNGVVRQSPHFPLWRDLALREPLQKLFPFPVVMDNDANHAALGEAWLGAGRAWPDFILITLGTGVGGGIILNGQIFRGPSGFAGEIGHMVIDRNGLPGALGSRGTLETLVSQSGLKLQSQKLWENAGKETSATILDLDPEATDLPKTLFDLAADGVEAAQSIWKEFGSALGCGIVSLANAFGYLRFAIGGGLSGAWKFFDESCRKEIEGRTYETLAADIEVVPATLGNDAGLIGGVRAIQLAR